MYDPDQFADKKEEIADLDKLLAKLQDCDLSEWDEAFVEGTVKRLAKFGNRMTLSEKQVEQLEMMKIRYGIE